MTAIEGRFVNVMLFVYVLLVFFFFHRLNSPTVRLSKAHDLHRLFIEGMISIFF